MTKPEYIDFETNMFSNIEIKHEGRVYNISGKIGHNMFTNKIMLINLKGLTFNDTYAMMYDIENNNIINYLKLKVFDNEEFRRLTKAIIYQLLDHFEKRYFDIDRKFNRLNLKEMKDFDNSNLKEYEHVSIYKSNYDKPYDVIYSKASKINDEWYFKVNEKIPFKYRLISKDFIIKCSKYRKITIFRNKPDDFDDGLYRERIMTAITMIKDYIKKNDKIVSEHLIGE